MRRLITFLLLVVIIPTAALSQQRRRPSAQRPVPKVVESKPALLTLGLSIEKYVSSYSINVDGTAFQTIEIGQKCVLETCIERVRKLEHVYNSELQNLKLLSAALIKKNGSRIDVTKDNGLSIPTPQAESAPGFSSLKQLEISFDKYELGDTVEHKFEVHTKKPIFGNHFDSLEMFPAVFEWKSIEINVSAPADLKLQFEATGLEGTEPKNADGRNAWQWKRSGLAAFPIETAMLDTQRMSPRFVVTTYTSFEQLGAAFGEGLRTKAVVTPEVQALADEVTKGLEDPSDQAAAIYQWVNKNIRYLLVVLDRGGWIPHSTDQILKNRYGDCKDYTALIYAMLKAKGIESVPVLINAQFGGWFPKVPAMEHFDHAILYIPKLNLYADATSANTRLGMIPQQLVGKTALQAGEKPGLITVPRDRPDDNQLLSEVEIEIFENGTLRSTASNTFAGRSEIIFRPLFTDAKRTGLADHLVKLQLAFYGLNGSGQILDISDPHVVSEPFTMKLQAELPDFTTLTRTGSLSIPTGVNALSMVTLEVFTKEDSRKTDLHVGATRIRERFKVKLPEKVVVGEMPSPVKFTNKAGTFELSVAKTANGFEMLREIVILKDVVEPSEYAEFKELVAKSVSALNSTIPYTSDGSLIAKRVKAATRKTASKSGMPAMQDALFAMFGLDDVKLTAADVRRLEARLRSQPEDVESREKLLRHYRRYDLKETPAIVRSRREHRLWFVRNKPVQSGSRLIGWYYSDESSPEYVALREEWKKQVATQPKDMAIWLNAVEFVQFSEPALADDWLVQAKKLFPDAYEFPRELSLLLANRYEDEITDPGKKLEFAQRSIEQGKQALLLLKKERSEARDTDRAELLRSLTPLAFSSGDLDLAELWARELVLDFGGDPAKTNFEEAAHIGNTVLGKSALAKNDLTKAVEYLLISIRTPLRNPGGYFYELDLSLAAELFKKGEKKAVSEFLTSALKISGYVDSPDVNGDEIAAIKKWIADIEKGLQPSFDFDKP